MPEQNPDALDLDYIIMTAALAGALTAIATAATLLARPMLLDMGSRLPLPSLQIAPREE